MRESSARAQGLEYPYPYQWNYITTYGTWNSRVIPIEGKGFGDDAGAIVAFDEGSQAEGRRLRAPKMEMMERRKVRLAR